MDSKNIKFKGTEDCGPRLQNKEVFMNVLVGHEVSFMVNDEQKKLCNDNNVDNNEIHNDDDNVDNNEDT